MKLFSGLESIVKTDEPMSRHTWMCLGGPAKYFVTPSSVEQLQEVVRRCRDNDVPTYVLGAGANLVVSDEGVDGAVIHLTEGHFQDVIWSGPTVRAGAGADLSHLVLQSVRRGMTGLEALAGIPGTVGGAIRMNAGGTFGDIGASVEVVHVMDSNGEVFTRHRADLAFGYRSSNINAPFILGAEFDLHEDEPDAVLHQVKKVWIYKKTTQPFSSGTCGCIFKNPRGMSAGALIDQAEFKGKRVGGAHVSEKHGNFILADKGAKAADVLELIRQVRERVKDLHGVSLELEIVVW
jgi:UDP-N-acetylmuramate dehydrogenase